MKRIIIMLCLVLMVTFLATPASAIIGGDEDFEHTNVGALIYKMPNYGYWGRMCTVTLIKPQVLLTAGHCFIMLEDGGYEGNLYVTFNQNVIPGDVAFNPAFDPADDDEYLFVAEYDYPEDIFEDMDDQKDIALVFLSEPVHEIEIQDLPPIDYLDDVSEARGKKEINFTIVGYRAGEFIDFPEKMLDAVRKSGTVVFKILFPYKLATFQNVEDGQLCHGDSGGPIFHESKGVERMVGILGGGFGDAWGCKADSNHYRLDKQSTQEWIEEQIDFYFNKK